MNVALAFWGRGDSALEEGSSFEIWGIYFGGEGGCGPPSWEGVLMGVVLWRSIQMGWDVFIKNI